VALINFPADPDNDLLHQGPMIFRADFERQHRWRPIGATGLGA
jgi:hypothetical protein